MCPSYTFVAFLPNTDGWTRTNNCLSGFAIAVSTYGTKEKMFFNSKCIFHNQMFYQLNYVSLFIIACLYYFQRHFGVVRSTNKHNFFTEISPEMPITWIRNRTYFLSYLISFSSVFLCSFEQLYNTIFQENVNRFLKVFSFIFGCLSQGFGEIPVSPFLNRKFPYINHTYL